MIHVRDRSLWLKELKSKGVVKITGAESFKKQEFVDFCKSIGECNTPQRYFNDPEYPEIFRITKELKNGQPIGMFAEGDLGWHSNGSSRAYTKHICVALFCLRSSGQIETEWCDLAQAFEDLSREDQEFLRHIDVHVGPQRDTFYGKGKGEFQVLDQQTQGWKPLVQKHPYFERECFLFHHLFFREMKHRETGELLDVQSIVDRFEKRLFRDEYKTSFCFQPGDLILSDQLLTVHRRGAYEGDRFLFRAAFDYSKLMEKENE